MRVSLSTIILISFGVRSIWLMTLLTKILSGTISRRALTFLILESTLWKCGPFPVRSMQFTSSLLLRPVFSRRLRFIVPWDVTKMWHWFPFWLPALLASLLLIMLVITIFAITLIVWPILLVSRLSVSELTLSMRPVSLPSKIFLILSRCRRPIFPSLLTTTIVDSWTNTSLCLRFWNLSLFTGSSK